MVSRSLTIKTSKAFSLLELIIVLVLVSILAISLSGLTRDSVSSYIDAKDRSRLGQSSKWIVEKISREVREALPQSVRTGSASSYYCLEFMAIVNASSYVNLSETGNIISFNAVNYNLLSSSANYVAIMPISTSSIYSGGSLGALSSISQDLVDPNQVVIALNAATNFTNRSPQRRFYLLNNPISYCLNDITGKMYRYSNYTLSASQPLPPTGGSLVGENLSANPWVFNYLTGTLSRSGLLQINLHSQNRSRNFSGNQESIDLFQEVHVRNVP